MIPPHGCTEKQNHRSRFRRRTGSAVDLKEMRLYGRSIKGSDGKVKGFRKGEGPPVKGGPSGCKGFAF